MCTAASPKKSAYRALVCIGLFVLRNQSLVKSVCVSREAPLRRLSWLWLPLFGKHREAHG